jgi:hypothetical protein
MRRIRAYLVFLSSDACLHLFREIHHPPYMLFRIWIKRATLYYLAKPGNDGCAQHSGYEITIRAQWRLVVVVVVVRCGATPERRARIRIQ